MVSFSVKSKWKAGWRRLRHVGHDQSRETGDKQEELFRAYWEKIHGQLAAVERPLVTKRRRTSAFYESMGNPRYICAPMVIQSERAFRLLVRQYGVGLCFTPMILATDCVASLKDGSDGHNKGIRCPYAQELLTPCPEDRPLIVQLAGSDPHIILAAAQRLVIRGDTDTDTDVCAIDLNLGCPQHCAQTGNYGVYLVKNQPDQAVAIVRVLTKELDMPVSCKVRLVGGAEGTIKLAKRLEEAGASLITVHGRLAHHRDHQGPSDFDAIKAIRDALTIPVLVNGNCRTLADATAALAYTGCEGIMSATGLLRNPRLFAPSSSTACLSVHSAAPSPATEGLSPSGTLLDPCLVLTCALEYLAFAEQYPPPEVRCIRDHLQHLMQGLVQMEHRAVWDMLGNDYLTSIGQYRELVRLAAANCDVLEAIEGKGEEARVPVLTLQEIKHMQHGRYNVLDDENGDDGGGEAGVFAGMSMFDVDEGDCEEQEGEDKGIGKDIKYALEVQASWCKKLLDGSKTIETRAYPLPPDVLHEKILLIESPGGGLSVHGLDKGKAVGIVIFGESRRYETREEWAAEASQHGVDPSSGAQDFGWSDDEPKYAWIVGYLQAFSASDQVGYPLKESQRLHRSIFRLS